MNDVLWIAAERIASLLDCLLLIGYPTYLIGFRLSNVYKWLLFFTFFYIIYFTVQIMSYITVFENFGVIIYSVEIFVYALLALKGNIFMKLFAGISPVTVIIAVNSCVIYAAASFSDYGFIDIVTESSHMRLICMIISKIIITFLLWIICLVFKDKLECLDKKEWLLVFFIFFQSVVIFNALNFLPKYSDINRKGFTLILLIIIGLVILNILSYCIILWLSEAGRAKRENELLKSHVLYQNKYTQQIINQAFELRQIRHDLNNQYIAIDALMKKGNFDAAQEYIKDRLETVHNMVSYVDFKNDLVNAIINTKMYHAKTIGIDMVCKCYATFEGFTDYDLCSLLGNLLDNAIEAAARCAVGNRHIELNIMGKGGQLMFDVRNTVDKPVLSVNPELLTTKTDKSVHGLGTKIVKSIAKKYNGCVVYDESEKSFGCFVCLQGGNK